ncbi:MAG: DUF47 domain-containing protein [Syntrophomonadaceae bacterium]|nr:DUF47 domain-containing protein [Syntrophomonadaceae bacterium]
MAIKLKPREDKFFSYFEEIADAISEAADILKDFLQHQTDPVDNLELISAVEERGNETMSKVMDQINNSFVTPFDREDILELTREMTNVLDHIQGTMEKIVIYKAGKPKENYVLKLAYVLQAAAQEIKSAVAQLPDVRGNHNGIIEASEKIRSYEHEGDYLYRAGIALLFENNRNVIDIIKWKEIYEHLETTLDYCENVSNILKGIAVKYV